MDLQWFEEERYFEAIFENILMRFFPDLVHSSSPGLEGGYVAPQQKCPSGQKIGVCKKKNEV